MLTPTVRETPITREGCQLAALPGVPAKTPAIALDIRAILKDNTSHA
jgi:hypothetical protein